MTKNQFTKQLILTFTLLAVLIGQTALQAAGQTDMKLWYDKPAEKWEEALPVGNGRLGMMVYGSLKIIVD